jgi:hypothetical protein
MVVRACLGTYGTTRECAIAATAIRPARLYIVLSYLHNTEEQSRVNKIQRARHCHIQCTKKLQMRSRIDGSWRSDREQLRQCERLALQELLGLGHGSAERFRKVVWGYLYFNITQKFHISEQSQMNREDEVV